MKKTHTLVMIPGPTPVVEPIRAEMAREIQAFGDPRFVADYKWLIDKLGELFNCSGQCFPLAGTGTLAMEMAIANVTKRGDNILICSNGFFGDRFIEIAERKGLNVDVISAEWGTTVSPEQVAKALEEKSYAAVTVSHVDTATGVVAPIEAIGEVLKKYPDTMYIVDGVAATGAEYADVDGYGIDILFPGSQKAFGVSSGMFILWASKAALERRESLGTIPEYFVDFKKWLPIMDNPAKYFATPAVNLVWAMKKATEIIEAEGLKARYERHVKNARAAQAAFEAMGFKILAQEGCRATTLTVAIYPEGVDDAKFRNMMFEEGVICAGALAQYAGKAFRLGHMGNIDKNDMVAAFGTVERCVKACGADVKLGTAVGTYLANME